MSLLRVRAAIAAKISSPAEMVVIVTEAETDDKTAIAAVVAAIAGACTAIIWSIVVVVIAIEEVGVGIAKI